MRRSDLFATTSKQTEADLDCTSAELAAKAGLVHSYGSGTFGFTHLGHRVLENLEAVIRDEIDQIAQEVRMHLLQTADLWRKSGRWKDFEGEEFFHLQNRDDQDFCLAPTHEEAVVELVQEHIDSYRDLDLAVYQIGRKFRDDHARNGLIRAKEFIMKDAYSFHASEEDLEQTYSDFLDAYHRIMQRLGLDYTVVSADTGSMGGNASHEFLAEAAAGSDTYLRCSSDDCWYGTKDRNSQTCSECGNTLVETQGIEIGHLFRLGTRYSDSMDLQFDTATDGRKHVLMGCYGIGVSRLLAAVIEQQHDDRGITWNQEVAAFDTAVIAARHEQEVQEKAEQLHQQLQEQGRDVLLYDDRQSVGEQFAEADLLGIKYKVIIGEHFLDDRTIEIEDRDHTKEQVSEGDVVERLT
ncbi:MAG: aminoacyl--tRNA ligase-related protein [Candidatus Nanohaloarchaea archaeon]|nr:aminoacyl--tRNA ligase-related protein [Candidatus Nanohaloarchaea archaeon]